MGKTATLNIRVNPEAFQSVHRKSMKYIFDALIEMLLIFVTNN